MLFGKICKKFVSVLLSAIMIISLFTIVPFTAFADDGAFTDLSGSYTVYENTEVDNRITCSGDVSLTLADGVTMTVHGGINVTGNATLTINGTGALVIDGVGDNNAGIGGNNNQSLSSLTVDRATLLVDGGKYGAGIGGGKNGSCGKVTINGGTVTAHGGEGGAGIGSGGLYDGICGASDDDGVYISGGIVTATGGDDAAGIGEGYVNTTTVGEMEVAICISDGIVTAYSDNITPETLNPDRGKQDIGGDNTTISITGGNVYARGGGIASDNQVTFSWTRVEDSIYSYSINADVLLNKKYICEEDGSEYEKDQIYSTVGNIHPLEYKTLIPPFSGFVSASYIDENGTEKSVTRALKMTSDREALPSGWIAVTESVTVNSRIICNGDVSLILCDSCTLNAPLGITVSNGNSLTIYGQNDMTGKLSVRGDNYSSGAGIGGSGTDPDSGEIIIVGGTIDVDSDSLLSSGGAAIGGGLNGDGSVTIKCSKDYPAIVTARSWNQGAAIGSGANGKGIVNISGGKIATINYSGGAGIGGGSQGIGKVTINGGEISVEVSNGDIGIGGDNSTTDNSTVSLSWTNETDSIFADSYLGNITLEKLFKNKDDFSEIFTRGEYTSDSLNIGNKTIIPHHAFTVTWKNYNDSVLKTELVEKGEHPAYNDEKPQKPDSSKLSYWFKGWTDGETSYSVVDTLPVVTRDVTYTAEFTEYEYVAEVEPYLDDELEYHTGVVEHYVINGKNYKVNDDGSIGEELDSVVLSDFVFELINNNYEYQIKYFTGDTSNLTELLIPKAINGKPVTVLGNDIDWANDSAKLITGEQKCQFELILNENIREITPYSFWGAWVTKVTGDTSGLSRIGNFAFSWANGPDNNKLDIKLDYEGTVTVSANTFNHVDLTIRLKHATKFSESSFAQIGLNYIFTDNHICGNPEWTWTEDFGSATATFTCTDPRCGGKETIDAEITTEETLEKVKYTAKVVHNGKTWTDVKVSDNEVGSRLAGYSLSLDGDIGVNFYMELSGSVIDHKYHSYILFTIPKNGEPEYRKFYVKDATKKEVNGKEYYVFKCTVAAKEMTSEIKAQLFDTTSEKFSPIYTYSVRDYAKYLLENAFEDDGVTVKNPTFANAVPLVKRLISYGSYAQIYFDKNKDNLASDGLLTTEEMNVSSVTAETINKTGYAVDLSHLPEGADIEFDGATLSLKSQTTLSLYFTSNEELTYECGSYLVESVKNEDYWVARVRNIPSGEAQNDFTVTVKTNGEPVGTVTYSPMNYCSNALSKSNNDDLKNVVRAFYLYTEAAKDYFPQIAGGE